MNITVQPFINIGPGQIIKREMEALNWSQEDLAQILGLSPKTISHILNNKQPISIETAILLGSAFGTSPELWLNLDRKFRLRSKTDGEKEQATGIKARIRRYMPLLEMRKKGWIQFDNSAESQIQAFCEFWNLSNIDFSILEDQKLQLCARQSGDDEQFTKFYTRTWLEKARNEASKIVVKKYSRANLLELLNNIENYISADNGLACFIEKLNSCGVKFLVLSHLEKTYLDGAAFMDKTNPVVVFTGRHKGLDSFWWTVVHELAHVLLHLNSDSDKSEKIFLDNLDLRDIDAIEEEANQLTGKILKRDEILKVADTKGYFTENKLLSLAEKVNLIPGLVLGILQFEKIVTYRTKLNALKFNAFELIPTVCLKG